MLLLEVESLSVYHGELCALDGVGLQVRTGELVALVGANGAGKTTLINTLSGLHAPAAGTIRYAGRAINTVPPNARPELGLVQVPEGRRLFGHLSVLDNLLLGAFNRRARREREATLQRVCALLPTLWERRHQRAGSLSGGEQQMVALGRALMAQPRLLMLDEPSLGLAPKVVSRMFAYIDQIRREGVTILLVEQNVRQALALCDRAYVLQHGRIVLAGTGADLAARPDLAQQLLGVAPA